jgi:hypothetical protein
MAQENWARPGMPPQVVEVICRQVLYDADGLCEEIVHLVGANPILGIVIRGLTGPETVVVKQNFYGEQIIKHEPYFLVVKLREQYRDQGITK